MAIRFGTTRGVTELAETGPTQSSRISARADMEVRKVTAVFEVTDSAAKAWEAALRGPSRSAASRVDPSTISPRYGW